jgi:O-antigen ligase/tetratricopeptide (TPR) repeat protein
MAETSRPWSEPSATAGDASASRWRLLTGPAAQRLVDVIVVAFVGSWLGFYIITLWPGISLRVFRATIAIHAVTAVVLVPYLLSLVLRRRLPGGSLLDVPVVLAVGAYFIATAASENWRVSLESTLYIAMAASVFFVLSDRQLFRRWQVELGLMLALLAAAMWALWNVGEDYAEWVRLSRSLDGSLSFGDLIPPTVPRVSGVGDHENLLAMALAMGLPFFLLAIGRRNWLSRAFGLVGLLIMSLALFLTLSRGGWLGALVGCTVAVVAAAVLYARNEGSDRARLLLSGRRRWLLLAGGVACGTVFVAAVAAAAYSSDSRPQWLFRESASPRAEVLETGLDVYRDYPLLGAGPDTFGLLYPEYSGENPRYHYHVHNGFFQAAIDAGLPGIAAMLLLIGAACWLVVSAVRRTSGATRLSLIAAGGGLLAFATHSMLDAPNQSKTVLVTLAAVAAVAALASQEDQPEGGQPEGVARWALAVQTGTRFLVPVMMAGMLIAWSRLDAGHYYYSSAVANANAGNWAQAIDQAERATDFDPDSAVNWLQLGTIQGAAHVDNADMALRDQAIASLERAVELEPRSALVHANLAMLLAEAGERERARAEALAALRFANGDSSVALAAGTALEQTNYGDDAAQAYSDALLMDASLIDSPFWQGSPYRETRFEDILGRSALVFNSCALLDLPEGALPGRSHTQLIRDCEIQVVTMPDAPEPRLALAQELIEQGDLVTARLHIDHILVRQPDSGLARTTLGSWYAAQGDIERARQEWLRAGQLDEVPALVLLGDSYPTGNVPDEVVDALRSRINEVASQAQFPLTSILYYRRSFYRENGHTLLIPGEWQEAVPAAYREARDALERWRQ